MIIFNFQSSDGGRWISTVTKDGVQHKVEAYTKPECIYNITCKLLGSVPTYLNFTKWYCYHVNHPEVLAMTAVREHILELMSLQYYVDRQLFTNRVEIVLEVLLTCRINLSAFLYRFIIHILDPSSKTYFVTDVSSFDFNDFLFLVFSLLLYKCQLKLKELTLTLKNVIIINSSCYAKLNFSEKTQPFIM